MVSTTVRPSPFIARTTSHNERRPCGSSPGGRLVEEDDFGIVDQRQREREPLRLTAGERDVIRVRFVLELHELEQLLGAAPLRVVAAEEIERLARRDLVVEARGLQLHADARADLRARCAPRSGREIVISPASGRVSPSIISSVVVLPAPFGPRRPKTSPEATVRSTPATASTFGNCLRSPRTAICSGMRGEYRDSRAA